jgi:hypothetical protein
VAVTRAKALTVIVGNPYVLYYDPSWREFLEFVRDNDGYRGCECSLLKVHGEDEGVEDLLDAIANISLLGKGALDSVYPVKLEDFYNDDAWRVLL